MKSWYNFVIIDGAFWWGIKRDQLNISARISWGDTWPIIGRFKILGGFTPPSYPFLSHLPASYAYYNTSVLYLEGRAQQAPPPPPQKKNSRLRFSYPILFRTLKIKLR